MMTARALRIRRVLQVGVVAALLAGGSALHNGFASGLQAAPTGRPAGQPVRDLAPVVPDGVGDMAGLTPAMRRAVTRAQAAAAADGVELRVTSGWRSRERQRQLYVEAIAKYGSPERARRWVLPPEESEHVAGRAVDVGPESGARWLEEHGVRFGLCRRYDNEPWHFERLAVARGSVCPPRQPHA
jgi:D-alanyl-D-alanine carboxypeptidase